MTEPKKTRSIDFLSPEQLRRKREGDRNSARLARDQRRAYIQNLELRVQQLEQQNYELEQKLASCQCHDINYNGATAPPPARRKRAAAVASEQNDWQRAALAGDGVVSTTGGDWTGQIFDVELLQLLALSGFGTSSDMTLEAGDPDIARGADGTKDMAGSPPMEIASTPQFQTITNDQFEDQTLPVADPRRPLECPVWLALPKHVRPTCKLDQVVADLIQSRRSYELIGGNILEFQERPFPSIPSLLNPVKEADRSPVTSSIVTNIIRVMTVPTVDSNLPEQIAILYFMSSVIRWQISPTEANFNSMPEWLRPTPSQVAVPHPVWLDLFVWPKARERLCRETRYHDQNAIMTEISNESISVNWPYGSSNVLMQENGSEIVLNPVFGAHIKNLDNWSLGPRILEVFPELVDDVRIRRTDVTVDKS